MKKIISEIRKNVNPSKNEENKKIRIAETAYELVEKEIRKYHDISGIVLGGSFAKGTWLSDKADIDIFLKFKKSVSKEKFTKISQKVGFDSMKKFQPYVRYSEHPYVEARINDTKINVVPCYDVKLGNWKSAADRSPFHTEFMKKSLSAKMKQDVRVLKTFLKNHEIYGAEIAKQGFSGYVSEVLILNFGSFENLVKSISTIKEKTIIGKSKKIFDTIISIIDPIDENRNLAAAISNENIAKFVFFCRAFEKKPSKSFFKSKNSANKRNLENVLTIKFDFKNRSPDIIWGQIKRATTTMSKQLEIGGFNVLRSKAFTDEKKSACLFFLLESPVISKNFVKKGPEFFKKGDSDRFISTNIKKTELMWIDSKRIVSLEKRKNNDCIKFVKDLLGNNLSRSGIPTGLQKDIKKGFNVYMGNKKFSKSIKEEASELISTNVTMFYST